LRREVFTGMGVDFRLNTEVGKDVEFGEIIEGFDAVFVGIGTYGYMRGGLGNEDTAGVYDALDYLIGNNDFLLGCRREEYPYIDLQGKVVVVLGGGDTAMDCLRTAVRQGATEVCCVYRRDRVNMPGSPKEVVNAEDEGVRFEWNVQPLGIETDDSGGVFGVRVVRTKLGALDEAGRRKPEPISGTETVMEADAVILAFGFQASPPAWLTQSGVELDSRQLIKAPFNQEFAYQTTNEKIFAGGDAVRGSDLVVTAIAEGRMAAESILDFLQV